METIEQLAVLFFDNAISRIVPGCLVFCLYFPELRHRALELGTLLATAIFIAIGWTIGFVLEYGVFAVAFLVLKWRPLRCLKEKLLNPTNPRIALNYSRKDHLNIVYQKMAAEKIFFRVMATISLILCFGRPDGWPIKQWACWDGIIGIILFSICWWTIHTSEPDEKK